MNKVQFITVAGTGAVAELERLLIEYSSGGLYPILVGDAEDKERVVEGVERGPDPAETLQYSRTIAPRQWLKQKRELEPELYEAEEGDWPVQVEESGLITHLDISTRTPKSKVFIALLQLNAPWEAFAYLNWGAWNDCPEPAVHGALHRDWALRYGAEVVSITGDIVQCIVRRPPVDRAGALALAREQYVYCSDIVEQGVGTIAALGARLLNAKYWYFWWD